jgi:hypothetical protein
MYKQILDPNGNLSNSTIRRVSDGACIPFAEGNTDYQEYLKWVAAGNTPEPADE